MSRIIYGGIDETNKTEYPYSEEIATLLEQGETQGVIEIVQDGKYAFVLSDEYLRGVYNIALTASHHHPENDR